MASVLPGNRTQSGSAQTDQAVLISSPGIQISCSLSETNSLGEPIPKAEYKDTFPWQIDVNRLSCSTLDKGLGYPLLKPVSLEATLTSVKPQETGTRPSGKVDSRQKSLAVHINMQPVLLNVSRSQVEMISSAVSSILYVFSAKQTAADKPKRRASDIAPSPQAVNESRYFPSPPHSVISMATLPQHSSISGTSSDSHSRVDPSNSHLLLWIQCAVSKISFALYAVEEDGKEVKVEAVSEDLTVSWDQQAVLSEGQLKMSMVEVFCMKRYYYSIIIWLDLLQHHKYSLFLYL